MYQILARAMVVQMLMALMLMTFCSLVYAERTDVVYLKNGDRVTGEIKSLYRGRLEFKTDHMGTLLIDWEDIREIVSDIAQSVELTNGQRFYGPLNKPENLETVAVKTEQGDVTLNTHDITNLYPVDAGFWQRLDLSFKLGFNWDKSSDVGKYNLGADAIYRHPDFITRAGFSTELTTQSERDTTTRANLNASHMVFKPNKRFRVYFGSMDHNDNLGIDLRTLAGAGVGWFPVRSNRNWFALMAGLDVNHEIPAEGSEETNLEGVLGVSYEYFKFAIPRKSFKSDLMIYPSITGGSRVRAEFKTNFDIELVRDFFWDMGFYTSYDSKPISTDAASVDYGINSSLAYKF
jgi:hypothetical protein